VVKTFSPDGFLAVPIEELRGAGLSKQKAACIVEAAKWVSNGCLNLEALHHQSDKDVIATLTELPGVGLWTAQMFLIFALKRPDVLAPGDVGLQSAARMLYGDDRTLEVIGQAWKPYRSVASWYLWRHSEAMKAAKKSAPRKRV
jgi:DNA-3-methyladenine glycosylase II